MRLQGAVNVRDVGGLPVSNGGAVRPGVLLRSDNLEGLTPSDVDRLTHQLQLRRVVDLRTSMERRGAPPGALDDHELVRQLRLPLIPEQLWDDAGELATLPAQARAEQEAVNRQALLESVRSRAGRWAETDTPAVGFYLGYLDDRPANLVAAMRAVAEPDGATLVHCAAGKDRTGVVVALALEAVGVPRPEVVADYAASAEVIDAIIARLVASGRYSELDPDDTDRHAPKARTLEVFLDEVDRQHGGPAGWLAEHGFGRDEVAGLRDRLVQG